MDKEYQVYVYTDQTQFERIRNVLACLEGTKEVTVKKVEPLGHMGGEIILTVESENPMAVQNFVVQQIKPISGVIRTSIQCKLYPVWQKEA